MNIFRFLVLTTFMYISLAISAQHTMLHTSADSLSTVITSETIDTMAVHPTYKSRLLRSTYIGVPLIAGGLLAKQQDINMRGLRNSVLPNFKNPTDDYIQYLPAALMLGMKIGGVPSRSSWKRMLTSDAVAMGLVVLSTQTIKRTALVTRPDGSNRHSFPSGHTATTFMTATMLNKEYGHLSPWVGIGAYTVATTTGLMRIANNRHWLSDVATGAGIGIMATEFAYWITDIWMKDKGLNRTDRSDIFALTDPNPSFVGLYMGLNIPMTPYATSANEQLNTHQGIVTAIEGAKFFGQHIGVGGRMAVSNLYIDLDTELSSPNTMNNYSFMAGPYFNLPLTNRWSLMSKLLAGYNRYERLDFTSNITSHKDGMALGTGLRLNYRVKQHLSFSLFADYNLQHSFNDLTSQPVHIMIPGLQVATHF